LSAAPRELPETINSKAPAIPFDFIVGEDLWIEAELSVAAPDWNSLWLGMTIATFAWRCCSDAFGRNSRAQNDHDHRRRSFLRGHVIRVLLMSASMPLLTGIVSNFEISFC
jgi:hypothetical protein